jgi:CubicO group peptidase (beta-lactamase class C family)
MSDSLLQILEEIQRETGVPAVAGIVVSHTAVLSQAAIGVRRLGDDDPITIHDRFHAGSNTKAMTATACASLVDMGTLSWQMTPLDVFPDLGEKIVPKYKSITLEMLLRHMAGIPPYMDDEADDYILPDWKGITKEQEITYFSKWLLQNRKPINEPGTAFSYSNAGYSVATAMAETATGKSWQTLLQETLFLPLGIDAVVGSGWPALHDPNQPWGHHIQDGKLVPHPPDDAYQLETFLAPAGDVSISLPHYGRFLQMHLKALHGKETILPGELIHKMHNYSQPGNGMGWGVTTLRSLEALGLFSTHAGSAGTFILVAGISHAEDRAVALATNAGVPEALQGIKKIIACFVGTD